MDVISLCIIPGKKAAVFKDILSTLHILFNITRNTHRKGITAKSEFLFHRLHLSVLCALLTD